MMDKETIEILNKIYKLAEMVLGDAPDESECTNEENEVYAELANFVNAYTPR